MKKIKIKKGDTVKVVTGSDRGNTGKVLKIILSNNKALVEGVKIVTKHIKPSATNPKGSIEKIESPIDISNLSLVTSDGEITKVGYRINNDNKKERYSKKNNEIV